MYRFVLHEVVYEVVINEWNRLVFPKRPSVVLHSTKQPSLEKDNKNTSYLPCFTINHCSWNPMMSLAVKARVPQLFYAIDPHSYHHVQKISIIIIYLRVKIPLFFFFFPSLLFLNKILFMFKFFCYSSFFHSLFLFLSIRDV